MPNKSDEPLRKVTLNLFEEDCKVMAQRYGRGWTERVRDLVRARANLIRETDLVQERRRI